MKTLRQAVVGTLLVGVLSSGSALAQTGPYTLTWDDFSAGILSHKWFHTGTGGFWANDGVTLVLSNGLYVAARGTNPSTGLPAFTLTMGQEEANGGYPGGFDHMKWNVYMNHVASSGYMGFDAVPGETLTCSTRIIGQTFGTRYHPFGKKEIPNSADDLRLATFAMNTVDFESYMVFDFMFTNKRVYAVYERLPYGWSDAKRYAAFTYAIPVATRQTGSVHQTSISYDRSAGMVRWTLDGREVFRVSQVGHHLDSRKYMILDHGGEEELVNMRQLNCGMGMFTLLDASTGSHSGLVRLSSMPEFYYLPSVGAPTPQSFVDEYSQPGSRLWGQGAEFRIAPYVVSSTMDDARVPEAEPYEEPIAKDGPDEDGTPQPVDLPW